MAEDSRRRQSTDSIIFPIEGMESVVATVSGYVGIERFNLIKLISRCGGNYVGYMNKTITHLVCWKYEGRKYELARKFKTKVVNHQWIEDCIKKGRRIPEYPYTLQCGQEVGPLLLNISINNDQEKRPSTLPESSSKRRKRKLVKKEMRDILQIPSDSEQNDHRVSAFQEDTAAFFNNSDAKRHEPLYDSTCAENRSGKTEFLNDLEPIQDGDGVFNSDQSPHLRGTAASHVKDAVINVNCTGGIARLPASTGWSCVICMEFSAIRGVLMCGHRFCYVCIKTWADLKNASGKDSTCPICKTLFKEII